MTFVGFLGLLISICSIPFALPGRGRDRYFLGLLMFGGHVGAALVYYSYVQHNPADTALYYFDPYGFSRGPTSMGTVLVIQIVQYMRRTFSGSYIDYFLLFQSVGLLGIVILSRLVHDVHVQLRVPVTRTSVAILFLPSMYFWTSAIGKDSPLFFACSVCSWSILKFSSRWYWFFIGVSIMILFRPHIAFIAVLSIALSLFLDPKYKLVPRLVFLAIAAVGSIFVVEVVRSTLQVNVLDPNSVSEFIASRQSIGSSISGNTAVGGSFPLKLFSLLFRPLFFDAHGIFALFSSAENLIFVASFISVIMNLRTIRWFFRDSLFIKYCVFFTVALTLSLAAIYYNVGLGLRERAMVYPTLIPLFLLGWAAASIRRSHRPRLGAIPVSRAVPRLR